MKKPKIALCGFREWAESIFHQVISDMQGKFDFIQVIDKTQFDTFEDDVAKCDLIFFVGWSWIVSKEFVENNTCICLHPSPLPKYRGGSPIQHQVMNGEKESAVTYFKMDEGIDTGPIAFQHTFSLAGELSDIFAKIISLGIVGMKKILNDYLESLPVNGGELVYAVQDESQATSFKRRTPEQSELTLVDLQNAETAYNKIRALQDPYPNAYIVCEDGTKLFIKAAEVE